MRSQKAKKKSRQGASGRVLSPHELFGRIRDALHRKRSIKISFFAGDHPLEREVTAIEPGAAADGSEALVIVDDGRTVPITTILSATIADGVCTKCGSRKVQVRSVWPDREPTAPSTAPR
jgi:hypothetical protein